MTGRVALLLAALALAGAAAAGAGGSTPRFSGCLFGKKSVVRPAEIVVACGDGNFYLTGLRWSRWDGAEADAAGIAHQNDCKPYCAAGHFHTYPATVRLSRPRPCKAGLTLYTRLSWRFVRARPAHVPRGGTVPFPVPRVGRC